MFPTFFFVLWYHVYSLMHITLLCIRYKSSFWYFHINLREKIVNRFEQFYAAKFLRQNSTQNVSNLLSIFSVELMWKSHKQLWYLIQSSVHVFEWWCKNYKLNFFEQLIGHWLKITYYENDVLKANSQWRLLPALKSSFFLSLLGAVHCSFLL